jgi:hypothetical protein
MIPIVVTLVGIVTEVSPIQLLKAPSAIEVNCVEMTTSPTEQSNQVVYLVTDDGMIDGGNDVTANASPPNDRTCHCYRRW